MRDPKISLGTVIHERHLHIFVAVTGSAKVRRMSLLTEGTSEGPYPKVWDHSGETSLMTDA